LRGWHAERIIAPRTLAPEIGPLPMAIFIILVGIPVGLLLIGQLG
jgi:hypothetical protein